MDKNRMSWSEAVQYLIEFNKKHDILRVKGSKPATCVMVAVISPSSFNLEYSLESRSYAFTNHNKFFIPSNIGKSIFASSLAGDDNNIRLDQYVPVSWKVEYCYIKEENAE
jgi:hypothetical protein